MPKMIDPVYAEKVKKLSKVEAERLLSRMSGKLPHRLEKDKLTKQEALALQMELEDEQLQEWRNRMAELNHKIEKQKLKEAEKAKPSSKTKAAGKSEKAEKVAKSKKSATKKKDAE